MKNKVHIIYKVTNTETGMSYIGATTKSVEVRKADHLQKANKETASYFQRAILTYGPDAFIWEQVDTANSINELAQKEREYITKYDTYKNGYNSDIGGGFRKYVYMFDCAGEWLATHYSLTNIEDCGFDRRRISYACLNGTLYADMFWSYSEDSMFEIPMDSRKKKVLQRTLTGDFVDIYSSVADASRENGISKTCISRCCRGERKSSGGFTWEYRL